jgi:hypothetical protein
MKLKRITFVSLLLLLLALVGSAQASSVFVAIEPASEMAQSIECPIGCQSIGGNVSTNGGCLDFSITDPSGNIILHHENVSFLDFKVDTPTNGTYTIHMSNRLSTNNVIATLHFGRNITLVFYLEATLKLSATATSVTSVSDHLNPFEPLAQIGYIVFVSIMAQLVVGLLHELILRGYQKHKDGKPKTPVVVR